MNKKTQRRRNKFLIEILKTKCSTGSFGNGNKWNSRLVLCWCIKYRKYEDYNSDFAKMDVFVEKKSAISQGNFIYFLSFMKMLTSNQLYFAYIHFVYPAPLFIHRILFMKSALQWFLNKIFLLEFQSKHDGYK